MAKGSGRGLRNASAETRRRVGRLGGMATSQTHGREFYQEIGRKGGVASPSKFLEGSKKAKEAGRKGGQARGRKGMIF